MFYLDTSALVPLFVNEPRSAAMSAWYAKAKGELVCAVWAVTEFASALGIKQRTGQLDAQQAKAAWARFGRMAASDLRLLPLEHAHFHRAAELTLDASSSLRAGDALHLACAEHAGARHMVTFDDVLSRNAKHLKIRPVVFA